MKNFELFKEIIQFVKNNPEHWDQRHWHCGTSHCIAGFAQMHRNGLPFCKPGTDILNVNPKAKVHKFSSLDGEPEIYDISEEDGLSVLPKSAIRDGTLRAGMKELGIDESEASWLFAASRKLEDFDLVIECGGDVGQARKIWTERFYQKNKMNP